MARFLFYDPTLINILVTDERPSGGASVQSYGWIRGLLSCGQEVIVMTKIRANHNIKPQCSDINVVPFFNDQKGIRWLRWITYRIPFIYRQFKNAKPDFVYFGVPDWSTFFIALICRSLNIKLIQRISNDFMVDERIDTRFSRFHVGMLRLGLKMSHVVLCQNDYQFKHLEKVYPSRQLLKISNPIFQVYSGEPVPPEERLYIAWVGIFQYQKNLKLLFEIARALPNWSFRVAGREDPKCDPETLRYLALISALPNVTMVGFLSRNEVMSFISRAAYLLNTSHYEGFSNTFLEAMSAGTPILTSTAVNPDEIISTYDLGIVYSSVEELVGQLESISKQAYDEMSKRGQQYLHIQHDYFQLTQRLLNFLEVKQPTDVSSTDPVLDRLRRMPLVQHQPVTAENSIQ